MLPIDVALVYVEPRRPQVNGAVFCIAGADVAKSSADQVIFVAALSPIGRGLVRIRASNCSGVGARESARGRKRSPMLQTTFYIADEPMRQRDHCPC